ncbi:MAG: leucyl/phenylalanyl-tRNA--protein transferase [Candidatus Kapaibacterium sp.]|jgi:leucyl/phenylalanyl-tRNA--protein transferase
MNGDDIFFALLSSLQPVELTTELLEHAYKASFFPMADSDGCIAWHSPDPRAVFPLEHIRIAKSVRKLLEKGEFTVTVNQDFAGVIQACSRKSLGDDADVWISDEIIRAYTDLHREGSAHSVEVWRDGRLAGGLYGVSFGAAFFGESMFSEVSNASKVAFAFLVQRLREREYKLLDTQYANHFTLQLGAIEVPRQEYVRMLDHALSMQCAFDDRGRYEM